jgi:His-Xaa-Ser repeat protein HxsA
MRKKGFLVPSLVAAGFGTQDPAQAALTQAATAGGDDPHKSNLLRIFTQDHRVTLAQHRSHSSHSSHRSGGGGHYSHTSHRSSTGGYDPVYTPQPVYTPSPPPAPPPPSPLVGGPRATPPSPEALPALPGRGERFKSIVRRVQIALMAQGFFNGPVTGTVGPQTRAALRAFQTSRGLGVTGTITPQTLDALRVSSE